MAGRVTCYRQGQHPSHCTTCGGRLCPPCRARRCKAFAGLTQLSPQRLKTQGPEPAQLISHCQHLSSSVLGSGRESWLELRFAALLPLLLSNNLLPSPPETSCQDAVVEVTSLSPALAQRTQCRGTLDPAAAAAILTCHKPEMLSLSSDASRKKKKKGIK